MKGFPGAVSPLGCWGTSLCWSREERVSTAGSALELWSGVASNLCRDHLSLPGQVVLPSLGREAVPLHWEEGRGEGKLTYLDTPHCCRPTGCFGKCCWGEKHGLQVGLQTQASLNGFRECTAHPTAPGERSERRKALTPQGAS